MGCPWHEYWSGLPFPSPGDLPDPGIEPMSPVLAGGFFTTGPPETLCSVNNFTLSVQLLSRVWLFATPWTAERLASLSITNFQSLLKFMSFESVMPSNISSSVIPFSSHLQSFPASGSFQMSQFFTSGGQSIEVSASVSVLPKNIQDWFPLGWTYWISLLSKTLKSLLQYHSSNASILQCSTLFTVRFSHPYMTIGKTLPWLDGPLLAM